jgi:hypothetical protein
MVSQAMKNLDWSTIQVLARPATMLEIVQHRINSYKNIIMTMLIIMTQKWKWKCTGTMLLVVVLMLLLLLDLGLLFLPIKGSMCSTIVSLKIINENI